MEEVLEKRMGVFEDMEDELEMFDEAPTFNELLLCVKEKFDGRFILKGRFDSRKTRAHFVLMPLRNEGHWSCYIRIIAGSNVPMAEVVVEDGYREEDGPLYDCVVGDEKQRGVPVHATPQNMDWDGQLTHEQLESSPMAVDESRRFS
jgi:hypothetical protein